MEERLNTPALLADTVQDLARTVASALQGGGNRGEALAPAVPPAAHDAVSLAAARVLGADLLAPSTLLGIPVGPADSDLVAAAVQAFPPTGQSPSVAWSHWGMTAALQLLRGDSPAPELETSWPTGQSWQQLTQRLAPLAALAGLPTPCAPAAAALGRVEDLARGFVRAVRRRDWLQAAGAGRWLAAQGRAVPETLGLEHGLALVARMGAQDARVLLHTTAARVLLAGAAR
ncbi:hypothetical protein [Streptomyces sp. NPDC088746]|uniref:hypothetical protein n=1 Tax=Streptomyces sp. NPDC088746 TaxID=3365885 RepID=UPI00380A8D6C